MCRGLEFATLGSIALELSLDTLVQEELGEKPYRTIDGDVKLGLLILCDHAQNRIPEDFHTLGLRPEDLHRHTAFDLGAEGVTSSPRCSAHLPSSASSRGFSSIRNWGLDDPTLIMEIADGLVVPGNVGLSAAAREERLDRFYRPYDDAVGGMVGAAIDAGRPPVILSIHSFTQAWKGVPRPWHTSVLWDKDPRLPVPLLDGLKTIPDVVVGDNVPYSGQLKGDTLYRHATARGLAHALIEVRQDLILGEQGQAEWAAHLARVVSGVLQSTDGLNTIEYHGSHTGI